MPANDFDGTWAWTRRVRRSWSTTRWAGAHLVDASSIATTVVGTIAKVDALGIVPDGSAALYLVGGALKKATFADPPVVTDLLPSGVDRLFVMTKDSTTLLYAKTNAGGLNDLYALDLAAPGTPRALRASATNVYFGLTGTQTHAFVIDVADVDANRVYAVPIAGGRRSSSSILCTRSAAASSLEPSPASTGLVHDRLERGAGHGARALDAGLRRRAQGGGLEPAATILRARRTSAVTGRANVRLPGRGHEARHLRAHAALISLTAPASLAPSTWVRADRRHSLSPCSGDERARTSQGQMASFDESRSQFGPLTVAAARGRLAGAREELPVRAATDRVPEVAGEAGPRPPKPPLSPPKPPKSPKSGAVSRPTAAEALRRGS